MPTHDDGGGAMSGDQIYSDGAADEMDVDSVLPDGKPDKVREAERMREEREAEQNGHDTVEVSVDRLQAIEEKLDEQADRIDELEEDLEEEKMNRSQADSDVRLTLQEEIQEVSDHVRQEQIERSQNDALLKNELRSLANEAGWQLDELAVEDDDKIARLASKPAEDVVDKPSAVHRRAHDIVANIEDWGTQIVSDSGDVRQSIRSTRAREKLEDTRHESLSSNQVRRVFEKIVELGMDSPRTVKVDKNEQGQNRLVVEFEVAR